jgi:hypothetical protein
VKEESQGQNGQSTPDEKRAPQQGISTGNVTGADTESKYANGSITLEDIYGWLGHPAILIPIALGEKRPGDFNWQKLRYPKFRLQGCIKQGGNIGVKFGPQSGFLVAIDVDSDVFRDDMLRLNPWMGETLRTRGKRGCQFFLRIKPETPYPNGKNVYPLKTSEGKKFGEWRCGPGAQSIIFGKHPEGPTYQREVKSPPLVIEFNQIKWPEYLKLSWEDKKEEAGKGKKSKKQTGLEERISRYIEKIPDAVMKQAGSDPTFYVACLLVYGWDLSIDEARPYLKEYSDRCKPPWSEAELGHKLADAKRKTDEEPQQKPRGHLRGDFYRPGELPRASERGECPVYDETNGKFYIESSDGSWTMASEKRARCELETLGYSFERIDGGPAPADLALNDIMKNRKVIHAGPVAGHDPGFRTYQETRMLVTRSAPVIAPKKGDWSPLLAVLTRMFGEQLPLVLSLLKQAVEASQDRRAASLMLLVLAGVVNCGKTWFQEVVISGLLGGFVDPGQYMQEGTKFNSELMEKPHLLLSDFDGKPTYEDRLRFSGFIKRTVGNVGQTCYTKHGRPVTLDPLRFPTMSVNTEPSARLRVIPPLDSDIRDKMIIILVNPGEMPMRTDGDHKEIFKQWTLGMLPAMAFHLVNEFVIPEEISTKSRFGIKGYCHPEIEKHLFEMTNEMRLLEILESDVASGSLWKAAKLWSQLRITNTDFKDLVKSSNIFSDMLISLEMSVPEQVKRVRAHEGDRQWSFTWKESSLVQETFLACDNKLVNINFARPELARTPADEAQGDTNNS